MFETNTKPTQIKIKPLYREKLSKLAEVDNRSMANVVEVLIDKEMVAKGLQTAK